jgi:hypothetical protein
MHQPTYKGAHCDTDGTCVPRPEHGDKQAHQRVSKRNSLELAGRTCVDVAAAHANSQKTDNLTLTSLITTALSCTLHTSMAGSCSWHALHQQTQYAITVGSYTAHPYINIKSVQSWAPFQVLTRLQPPCTGGLSINNIAVQLQLAYIQQGCDEPHPFAKGRGHPRPL